MRAAGTTDVVLEATSHALAQGRLDGCRFRVAALTNLTQDHLDYHQTMGDYENAKAILFERLIDPAHGVAVTFADDEAGRRMRARAKASATLTVARAPGAEARGADVVVARHAFAPDGTRATVETPLGKLEIATPLVGGYNLDNLALAVGMAVARGLDANAIVAGAGRLPGVPGRLERVANGRGVLCLVDYAHTPDALSRAIAAVQAAGGVLREGARTPARRVRLRWRSGSRQAAADGRDRRARGRSGGRHLRQPSYRGAVQHRGHDRRRDSPRRRGRAAGGARLPGPRAAITSRSIGGRPSAPPPRPSGRATSCSSPARDTRTIRSSAPSGCTSTIARRRPWRWRRAAAHERGPPHHRVRGARHERDDPGGRRAWAVVRGRGGRQPRRRSRSSSSSRLPGERVDGFDFVAQAVASGAAGVVVARGRGVPAGRANAAVIAVDDPPPRARRSGARGPDRSFAVRWWP